MNTYQVVDGMIRTEIIADYFVIEQSPGVAVFRDEDGQTVAAFKIWDSIQVLAE